MPTNPPAAEVDPSLPSGQPADGWWRRLGRWLLKALSLLCWVLITAWGALAIYYSNLPWASLRLLLAWVFVGAGVVAFWLPQSRRAFVVFAVLVFAVLAWWVTIRPSQSRDWKSDVSVVPRALVEGDKVTFTGVRHFAYRSRSDFTPHYETREVQLSHLTGVDFFVSRWSDGPVAHTFLSFVFDNAPPVCVSIEARLEKDETYAALPSCFKQFEVIYVVGDERDIVRVRTQYRNEQVQLYHTRATRENVRRIFMSYIDRINALADQPEFYHLLSNNCTVNIDRHVNLDGRDSPFDLRLLLNGYIDAYAYVKDILDTSLPLEELRERSLINDDAQAADLDPDFSKRIREHRPKLPE